MLAAMYLLYYYLFLGKRSNDSEDVDWVPSLFTHSKKKDISEVIKLSQKTKRYNVLKKKRFSISQSPRRSEPSTSSNFELSMPLEPTVDDGDNNDRQNVDFNVQLDLTDDDDLKKQVSRLKLKLLRSKEKMHKYRSELNARNQEVYRLREKITEVKLKKFGFNYITDSKNNINFFTGLADADVFHWLLNKIRLNVELFHSSLSIEDHLLIVLMKLKLGLLSKDIAIRFNLSPTVISKIFRSWIVVIARNLKSLIVWPDRGAIRYNSPQCFKKKYRDAVCIIDCSEIFIQRPKNLTARAQTWSNYKHNNTVKYLIGISPSGAVMFLSSGWGGRVSDKRITIDSGFIDKLEAGDCILADRGFNVKAELAVKGAVLKIPSFTKGKKQLAGSEVDMSRQLANVRIHVERVIGRLKKFRILNSIIPITQVDLIDEIMVTICAIVNLNQSVVT